MFDALADEPVMVVKPAAAPVAAATKPGSKSLVGGVKKGDAPKRMSFPVVLSYVLMLQPLSILTEQAECSVSELFPVLLCISSPAFIDSL